MLKIITHPKFAEGHKILSPVDDYMNEIDFSQLDYGVVAKIVKEIDDVALHNDGLIDAKFSSDQRISVEHLSTGCKTALLIYSETAKNRNTVVDISECGEQALLLCFDLLQESEIIGLLYADILTVWQERNLTINNTHYAKNTSMICFYMED